MKPLSLTSVVLSAMFAFSGAAVAGDAYSDSSNKARSDAETAMHFHDLDKNNDGKLSLEKARNADKLQQTFEQADSDGDNAISMQEFRKATQKGS